MFKKIKKEIQTYFLLRPNIFSRAPIKIIKIINRCWQFLPVNRSAVFRAEKKFIPSNEPIDVIIPTIDREIDVLPYVIKGIRKNVKHPIKAFKIVAPKSKKIISVCERNKCQFIDEDKILPIKKSDFSFMLNGEERSGWIFQQFIKLSENLSSSEHYLVVDSDTVLLRPQVFLRDGKTLLLTNDEYYPTYGKIYKLLFGYKMRVGIRYYNSHQMLFTKKYVKEFQRDIKKYTGLVWYKAIIKNTNYEGRSVFADYLSYAAWMLRNHPDKCVIEYWYNLDQTREQLKDLKRTTSLLGEKYKSVSFHHYRSK